MPMFKKSKSEAAAQNEKPAEPAVPVAEATVEAPAAEEAKPVEDVKEAPAAEASEPKAEEAAAEKEEGKKEAEPAESLMQIFMEDQEGMAGNTSQYDAFLESLTMEQVSVNARTLLADVKKRLGA